MMGFGTYGYGAPYLLSSSSSSLSALAPPFTVERPVPKLVLSPLMEVTEPLPYATPLNSLHNWLPPHSPSTGSNFFASPVPAFDSGSSSNAYRYAGLPQGIDSSGTNLPPVDTITTPSSNAFTYDQGLDAAPTSFVEMKPYYPSYFSPTIHGDSPLVAPDQHSYDWLSTSQFAPLDGSSHHKEYTQRPSSSSKYTAQWGGSWNGLAEREPGKFDGSFSSKETDVSSFPYKNYINQELHSSNSLKSYDTNEMASHNIPGWDKTVNVEQLGDESAARRNFKFIPTHCAKPTVGSLFNVPETLAKAPCSPFVANPAFSVSYEKRQHDASRNDFTSIPKSSPAFFVRPPAVGTKSSEPEIGQFNRLNSGREAPNAYHGGLYPPEESHLPRSAEDKYHVGSSQFAIHRETNDPFSVESSSAKDREQSNNGSIKKDSLDHLFDVKPGLSNSHDNPDGFDAGLNTNDSINSILNSPDVDTNSTAVDSPCWKGVPGSRFSPFKASEEGGPERVKKLEISNGLNLNKPLEFHEFEWLGNGLLENGLPFPLKISSVSDAAAGEHKVEDTMETTFNAKSSGDKGCQGYFNIPKSGNANKSSSFFEHSHTVQQGRGEVGLTTEAKNTTWSVGADVDLNINDIMECGSSHIPSPAIQNNYCTPSVEVAATKLTKSNGEESITKMDVQMLVTTMKSLSELLLADCSSSSRQLNEKDLDSLKVVINNLESCILKNDENWTMPESPPLQQSTIQYIEKLCEPNKVVSANKPLTKMFAPSIQDPLDLQGFQKVKRHNKSVTNENEVIGLISETSDMDLLKEDKMTQDLKKILSENFHTEETHPEILLYKNLWLEAEAALCSTNYKARYNRLKIEMDKCKDDKSKDVLEHTADMMMPSTSEVCPASNPVEKLTPGDQGCPVVKEISTLNQEDEVMARFHVLRNRIENSNSVNAVNGDESSSNVSLFSDKIDEVAPEGDSRLSPSISIQDSQTASMIGLTDDYEASIMARFHMMRAQDENSKFINVADVEDTSSSSKVCHELKVDHFALDTSNDRSFPQQNIQDSTVSSASNHANQYEDPVLARLNILRSRVDNSGDMRTEGQGLENFDPEYAGKRNLGPLICNRSEHGSSDVKEQPVLQSRIADKAEASFATAKEFRLFVEDDPGTQYHMFNTPAKQLPSGCCPDLSSSSDWEHVMKEEIWGLNCGT